MLGQYWWIVSAFCIVMAIITHFKFIHNKPFGIKDRELKIVFALFLFGVFIGIACGAIIGYYI